VSPELEADLDLLRDAIAAAGTLALEHFHARGGHWYKGPGQVLTEADLAVDRLLHGRLIGARPDDGWLSEESADDRSRLSRARVWVVDPIDGTRAFADGVPEFAISVALVAHCEPVLGSVLNPATGECFEAWRGGGARLNGQRLLASDREVLAGVRLLCARTEMRKRNWHELLPESEFTTIGSLAYKLALVAAGRFDGLVSLRAIHDWDLAAAWLLIREAGARLTQASGSPLAFNQPVPRHQGLVAAGTAALHGALLARLRDVAEEAPSGRA
jgi:myo-inositol-1(or 4)-monophosphatase